MDYNYHTHTARCGHASGTVEEYIINAIDGGIRYMGFADHAPFKFEDGGEASFRVPFDEGREYCEEIRSLAEKYKDRIDIKTGFEAEYYPGLFESMLENFISFGAEYLILGQHFFAPENLGTPHSSNPTDNVEYLTAYADTVTEAIATGKFTYVAHPDMFSFTGDEDIYCEQMRRICISSREHDIPLELNFLGIRGGRHYPNPVFWKIAGEERAPVVFGFDAHAPEDAADRESLARAMQYVEEFKLNYIGRPTVRTLNTER